MALSQASPYLSRFVSPSYKRLGAEQHATQPLPDYRGTVIVLVWLALIIVLNWLGMQRQVCRAPGWAATRLDGSVCSHVGDSSAQAHPEWRSWGGDAALLLKSRLVVDLNACDDCTTCDWNIYSVFRRMSWRPFVSKHHVCGVCKAVSAQSCPIGWLPCGARAGGLVKVMAGGVETWGGGAVRGVLRAVCWG